jgi:hypothetical protein
MILVDTSVWVDHLRRGSRSLGLLLEEGRVLTHPFIIGELACGSIRNRQEVLSLLDALPRICTAEHVEVLHLIEKEHLYGRGIGWVDAHLLASTCLSHSLIWTSDNRLFRVAATTGIALRFGTPRSPPF